MRYVGGWLRAWPTLDRRSEAELNGRILAAGTSHNQMRVFQALRASGHEAEAAIVPVSLVTRPRWPGPTFPLAAAYLAALRDLAQTLRVARSAEGYQRLGWHHAGAEYALTPGFLRVARAFLLRARPGLVLVSNDHLMRTRVVARAANDLGIPTAYVQHASVTERFPPLFTSAAFLDGRDALEKYLAASPSRTRVFLTGSPLHDGLVREGAARGASDKVGVCLNLLDDPEPVIALVRMLQEADWAGGVEVRTHPRDQRPWRQMLASAGPASPRVVSAVEEPIERFLARVGKVVAGDSNVHLESAVFGRPSVCLQPSGRRTDAYGFARAGLTASVTNPGAAVANLEHAHLPPADVVQRFAANAGGPWAGRASELIHLALQALVAGEPTPAPFRTTVRVGGVLVAALDAGQVAGIASSVPEEATP